MKIQRLIFKSLFVLLLGLIPSMVFAQWSLDAETGIVGSGYNDVGIPGDTGTRFSLTKDFKLESSLFIRMRLSYRFSSRHTLSLFGAPLKLKATGTVSKSLSFNGDQFPANTALDATYRFNSYRLTYRYEIINRGKWRVGLGITAKVRDAAIGLKSSSQKTEKTNVGLVPLINFRVEALMSKTISVLVEGDALAAPQGRAEDVLLALVFKLNDTISLKAGYRILEGGADNKEVYNFALLHYFAVGALISF